MRFWLDTEFHENGRTIDLISIAIVAEDGREYHAEVVGAEMIARRSEWLTANVLPHLGYPANQKGRGRIADEIAVFVGESPEFWAYYADYDWVVLCQLFGTMMDLPSGWPMFCLDVKQTAHEMGCTDLTEHVRITTEHDALADARWTRDAWLWLKRPA